MQKWNPIGTLYSRYCTRQGLMFYAFYDTDFWIGCYCDQNEEDVYYIGNGGMSRLVRNVDTPRQTLFDDDIPDSDASIGDIAGRWIEDGNGNILLVMQDGTFAAMMKSRGRSPFITHTTPTTA